MEVRIAQPMTQVFSRHAFRRRSEHMGLGRGRDAVEQGLVADHRKDTRLLVDRAGRLDSGVDQFTDRRFVDRVSLALAHGAAELGSGPINGIPETAEQ